MKINHIFYLMILLIISSCGSKEVKHPEVGAWQLQYFKRIASDTVAFEIVGYFKEPDVKFGPVKNFISTDK